MLIPYWVSNLPNLPMPQTLIVGRAMQVLESVEQQLSSRPEQLTDLQRESQEEAQDRHERVQAATLQLATALLDMAFLAGSEQAAAGEASSDAEKGGAALIVCGITGALYAIVKDTLRCFHPSVCLPCAVYGSLP